VPSVPTRLGRRRGRARPPGRRAACPSKPAVAGAPNSDSGVSTVTAPAPRASEDNAVTTPAALRVRRSRHWRSSRPAPSCAGSPPPDPQPPQQLHHDMTQLLGWPPPLQHISDPPAAARPGPQRSWSHTARPGAVVAFNLNYLSDGHCTTRPRDRGRLCCNMLVTQSDPTRPLIAGGCPSAPAAP
jgi:hypothetical protein